MVIFNYHFYINQIHLHNLNNLNSEKELNVYNAIKAVRLALEQIKIIVYPVKIPFIFTKISNIDSKIKFR
ncbi:hypothetical protein TTHERM_00099870 (macronuclear) [Tetrahymena thermophila SB210]|uniref:Uncharacterized protein n=1 Tax=Tetrahymena thermophila (strain SB210) TaxID=312017 RepID=Q234W3_TETTS|nr:hypothetical protein TTHERM_00099870 [Tetrahymena thermophila SB210]EAR91890.1 hypothetical protein TTHERM_00099870 [Tetrahymena thermophila SB210]|eukprot:XP_001012135.1 hypothetical protein TTHERM_00099870 [Tetrahymena thermophila SB210]